MNTKQLKEYAMSMCQDEGTFYSWYLPDKDVWIWECVGRVARQDVRADMSGCKREAYYDEKFSKCTRRYERKPSC